MFSNYSNLKPSDRGMYPSDHTIQPSNRIRPHKLDRDTYDDYSINLKPN